MKELDLIYQNIHKLINAREQKITGDVPKQITKEATIQIDAKDSHDIRYVYYIVVDENANVVKKTDKFIGTLKQLEKRNPQQITMITKQLLSKTLLKKVPLIKERKSIFENISFAELIFCLVEHKNHMQNKYIKLDNKIPDWKDFYNLDGGYKNLLLEDRVCIWYNFHKNQIIQIEYPSNISGFTTEQRKVVAKTIRGQRVVVYPKEKVEEESAAEEEVEEPLEEEEEYDDKLLSEFNNPDNIDL